MAHKHSVYDSDAHFTINMVTREFSKTTQKLVQYDHNSERFTFDMSRFIDEHDMSLCDKVEVHYINISANKNEQSSDVYLVDDLQVSPDSDNVVTFSWLISANATKYAGTLNFLIRFVCLDGETIEYAWNTAIFDGITVDNGMDNGEAVIADYSDVLEAWKREVFAEFKPALDAQTAAAIQAIQRKADETLATIPEGYTAIDAAVKKNTADIARVSSTASRNSKRITNIEQGLTPDSFETDDSVAYQKDVPANALPYAAVQKVGGMTRKCANLFDKATVSVALALGKDGAPYSSETMCYSAPIAVKEGQPYSIVNALWYNFYSNDGIPSSSNHVSQSSGSAVTIPSGAKFIRISAMVNSLDSVMLNEGDSQPYEPYFEGWRSAKVESVESVGVQLIPFPYADGGAGKTKTMNGVTFTVNADGSITVNGTPTASAYFNLSKGIAWATSNVTADNGASAFGGKTFSNCRYNAGNTTLSINVAVGTAYENYTVYPMINAGSTALPYTPYVEHTLPIPEAVQALDGYGWGVNDSVYNYITWNPEGNVKTYTKAVGVVDLGTLNWKKASLSDGHYRFLSTIPDIKKSVNAVTVGNILCDIADVISNSESYRGAYGIAVSHNSKQIFLSGAEYDGMSETSFNAAMSGVMLYYELAEPIVTDISDLITADNLIGVEGGGALTFENEYGYAVPSEVEYQVEV